MPTDEFRLIPPDEQTHLEKLQANQLLAHPMLRATITLLLNSLCQQLENCATATVGRPDPADILRVLEEKKASMLRLSIPVFTSYRDILEFRNIIQTEAKRLEKEARIACMTEEERARALSALLQSWREEPLSADELIAEQAEWKRLKKHLDEDRLSDRKLFPEDEENEHAED